MKGGINKMTKNLAKKSLWNEVKTTLKVGVPVATVMIPLITNFGGYFSTKNMINNMNTSEGKEIVTEMTQTVYNNHNPLMKMLTFGDYLAAKKYLKNNS